MDITAAAVSARPTRRTLRRAAVAATLAVTLAAAAACSTAEAVGSAEDLVPAVLPAGTMLIDVRTPAEFAEGHVEGAINIPVELATFAQEVALLDPNVDYLVYCRTGRRADVAMDFMDTLGLTTTNLGSVDAASNATGIRIVR
jgi:rhodanese-related sulfurtransferase